MAKKYLLGLGNPSMCDDSIGLRLAEHFFDKAPNNYEAVDMAHDSLRILFYCEEQTTQIILVDCTEMGLAPGEYQIFSPEDVVDRKDLAGLSSHEGNLLQAIKLGKELGYHIPPIIIMGIEPKLTNFGTELSVDLQKKYDTYVKILTDLMINN